MSAQRFLGVLVAFAMAAYFAFTALRSNGDVTGRKAEWILVCLKPVPCLCFALLCRTWSTQGAITTNFVMIGLLFGALGDVLLSVPGSPQFDAGLGAFLIGHLWYIAAFSKSSALAARAAIPWYGTRSCPTDLSAGGGRPSADPGGRRMRACLTNRSATRAQDCRRRMRQRDPAPRS